MVGDGSTAEARPVTVGRWQGSDWFVTEGLKAGDQVIVDGGQTLRAGMSVAAKAAADEPGTGSGQAG